MKLITLITACLSLSGMNTLADNINLFDGKTLKGWEGDTKYWSVVDGAITGKCTAEVPCKQTTNLIYTDKEFDNFELTVSFRFMTKVGNSGIQYRSQRPDKKGFKINGYQADLEAGPNYSGILYDQGGRGIAARRGQAVTFDAKGKKKVSKELAKEAQKAQDSIKLGEWNTYKIIAEGNSLTHIINGFKTIEVIDNDPKQNESKGLIAFQLHAGPSMTIQYKDIDMLELEDLPRTAPKVKTSKLSPQWIWADKVSANQIVHFSKNFKLKAVPKKSLLSFTCDNASSVKINGKEVGKSTAWGTPVHVDVAKFLKVGDNSIQIKASNEDGIAGMLVKLSNILVTDGSWNTSDTNNKPLNTRVVAKYGAAPWGNVLGKNVKDGKPAATAETLIALDGFNAEKLYTTNKKEEGSWVAMCFDDKGTLFVGDQYGDIFMLTLKEGKITKKEKLKTSVRDIQGLLWAFDSLYISSQGHKLSGIYRMTDSDKDGVLDKTESIIPLNKGGEHGPHSIVVAPDGKNLLFIQGNFAKPPKGSSSIVNRNWAKDVLHPHLPDGSGHAAHIKVPAGVMFSFSPDGKQTKIITTGMRNTFDIAVSPSGDVFGYDADMEYDIGTPWYRPTRVMHLIEGGEFGWRTGTAKWPEYYADSLGSVVDIGPGCPTGVVFGTGAKFPAKYQKALYVNDWTFGVMYAVHLSPDGNGYTATKEPFVKGKPLALTDVTIGPDGDMYFLTGGRRLSSSLYRVKYVGKESTAALSKPEISKEQKQLRSIQQSRDVDTLWKALGSDDRTLRFAARVSLETLPKEKWAAHFAKETDPQTIITSSLAMSRLKGDAKVNYSKLLSVDFKSLNEATKLEYLRAVGLAGIRTGKPDEATRVNFLAKLDSHYPSKSIMLNRELCRLLVYLESDHVLNKTLFLMKSSVVVKADISDDLIEGNDKYGGHFRKMLKNMPDSQALHYALMLKNQKKDWTEQSVKDYYLWLAGAETKSGGNSYKKFIKNIRAEAMKNLSPALVAVARKASKVKVAAMPAAVAKGPGRAWTMEAAVKEVKDISKADYANGKKMFQAILCSRCHTHSGNGGSAGPDLTNLALRFKKADTLKAIIDPSEVISDQYVHTVFHLKNKGTVTGKIMQDTKDHYHVASNPFDSSVQTKILKSDIVKTEASKVSTMPPSLINALSPDELRDLMLYLTTEPK